MSNLTNQCAGVRAPVWALTHEYPQTYSVTPQSCSDTPVGRVQGASLFCTGAVAEGYKRRGRPTTLQRSEGWSLVRRATYQAL